MELELLELGRLVAELGGALELELGGGFVNHGAQIVDGLAKEVDADEQIERAAPEVADDLDALERVEVGVEVPPIHADLAVVLSEVLGHALREGRDEHLVALRRARADLGEQVVDLV